MEVARSTIEFTLTAAGGPAIHVRMRRLPARWLAEVSGPVPTAGLGGSARQALTAALQPLGDVATRVFLADLGLLEPSIAVLEVEAMHGSA